MHQETFDKLVAQYYEGETTVAEEQALRAYVREHAHTTPEMQQLAQMFGYFEAQKAITMPGQIAVPDAQVSKPQAVAPRKFELPIRRYLAAASVIGLLAVGMWWMQQQQALEQKRMVARARLYNDHYESPEAALAEVKAALSLVGSKINKGKETTQKGIKQIKRLQLVK
jgi:hypothetical protein